MSLQDELTAKYGRLLTSQDICRELRYPSVDALRAAKRRGTLPFKALTLKGRPGIFALTSEVAQVLEAGMRGDKGEPAAPSGLPIANSKEPPNS